MDGTTTHTEHVGPAANEQTTPVHTAESSDDIAATANSDPGTEVEAQDRAELRSWTQARLEEAGVSGPPFMLEALETLSNPSSTTDARQRALRQADGFIAGAKNRAELKELDQVLARIRLGLRLPEPSLQPSAAPTKAPGPVQAESSQAYPKVGFPLAVGAAVETRMLPIALIVTDAGTRVRSGVNAEVVKEYTAAMAAGAIFPKIVVFFDGSRYYLADGNHRRLASIQIGRTEILAEIHIGDAKAALWYALGANKAHGLRLTTSDKKSAVIIALKEFPERSQTLIAEQVGCAQSYVNRVKQTLIARNCANPVDQVITSDSLVEVPRVIGKDGKSHPATRPPRVKAPEPTESNGTSAKAPVRDAGSTSEVSSPNSEVPELSHADTETTNGTDALLHKVEAPVPSTTSTTTSNTDPTAEQVIAFVTNTIEGAPPEMITPHGRALIMGALGREYPVLMSRLEHRPGSPVIGTSASAERPTTQVQQATPPAASAQLERKLII